MKRFILLLMLILPLGSYASDYAIESAGDFMTMVQTESKGGDVQSAFSIRKQDVRYVGVDIHSSNSARLKFLIAFGTEETAEKIIFTTNDKPSLVFEAFSTCVKMLGDIK